MPRLSCGRRGGQVDNGSTSFPIGGEFCTPIKKGPGGAASKLPAGTRAARARGASWGSFFTPKKRTVVPTWSSRRGTSRRGTTTIPGVTRTLPAANFVPHNVAEFWYIEPELFSEPHRHNSPVAPGIAGRGLPAGERWRLVGEFCTP